MHPRRFIIAAAGTGGHILPGIQTGRALEHAAGDSLAVEYYCGSRSIEWTVYTGEGVRPTRLTTGSAGSFPPWRWAALAVDVVRVSLSFIRRRPAGVLAMGGAACVPVLAAAVLLRVPIFLHESNRVPGRVVRRFAPFARSVYLGLGGMEGHNVLLTGTPVRQVETRDTERTLVLCLGGSQGAEALNRAFVSAANSPILAGNECQFVLICGPGRRIEKPGRVEVREYEPDIPSLLARSRLAVTRAGAGTLAELALYGVPSILVPYPHAKDNHQLANARHCESRGAAVVLGEDQLSGDVLAERMGELLRSDVQLAAMGQAARRMSLPDAADVIATGIRAEIERFGRRSEIPSSREAAS